MNLLALKHRKKTIDVIYRASGAMKAAAVVRVRKVEKYLEEIYAIKSNDQAIKAWVIETSVLPFVMNKNATNKANILIGADKGMCGDFINVLQTYCKKKQNEGNYWLLFGSKLESKLIGEKIVFCGNVELDQIEIIKYSKIIWQFIRQYEICELTLHYFSKDKIKAQIVFSKEIMEKSMLNNEHRDLEIDSYLFEQFAVISLGKVLYEAMLESSLAENKQRLVAMTEAKRNAEDMGKIIARLYHKARQEKITRELTEITAGIV